MPSDALADVDVAARVHRLTPLATTALRRSRPFQIFAPGDIPVIESSGITTDLTLTRPRLEELLRAALALSDDSPSVVWVRGDSELAVHAGRARVALGQGMLVVGVPVETDQTGPAEITVPLALGSSTLAAGLVMATPVRPDGPALLVEQWGDVIVAAVHRALLDLLTASTAAVGIDEDGQSLLPGAVATDGDTLVITPQARHAIDRRRL